MKIYRSESNRFARNELSIPLSSEKVVSPIFFCFLFFPFSFFFSSSPFLGRSSSVDLSSLSGDFRPATLFTARCFTHLDYAVASSRSVSTEKTNRPQETSYRSLCRARMQFRRRKVRVILCFLNRKPAPFHSPPASFFRRRWRKVCRVRQRGRREKKQRQFPQFQRRRQIESASGVPFRSAIKVEK